MPPLRHRPVLQRLQAGLPEILRLLQGPFALREGRRGNDARGLCEYEPEEIRGEDGYYVG